MLEYFIEKSWSDMNFVYTEYSVECAGREKQRCSAYPAVLYYGEEIKDIYTVEDKIPLYDLEIQVNTDENR